MLFALNSGMKRFLPLLLLFFGIVALAVTQKALLLSFLQTALEWIGRQGILAPVLFVLFFMVGTSLLPMLALMMGGGLLFGIPWGVMYVSAGCTLSAALAFLIARNYSRDWAMKKIKKNFYLQVMDETVQKAGWKMVILTRLTPVFPFTLLNYTYGLSRIKFRDYILITWIGMLPGVFLNVYLGAVTGSLLGLKNRTPSLAEWIGFAIGTIASLTATFYMIKLIRETVKRKSKSKTPQAPTA